MVQGDVDVRKLEAFDPFTAGMAAIVGEFDGAMQAAGNSSASPAAAGTMPEGKVFMTKERQARDLLATYMTKTSDGLTAYQTALTAIGEEVRGLAVVTNQQMSTLLRPTEGPTRTDQAFNWERALAHQAAPQGEGGS